MSSCIMCSNCVVLLATDASSACVYALVHVKLQMRVSIILSLPPPLSLPAHGYSLPVG